MFIRYGYTGFGFPLWFSIIGLVLFALMIGSIVWLVVSLTRPGRHVGMRWYAGGGGYGAPGPPRRPSWWPSRLCRPRSQPSEPWRRPGSADLHVSRSRGSAPVARESGGGAHAPTRDTRAHAPC